MIQAVPQQAAPAMIPLHCIVTMPQIRTRNGFDEASLTEMAASMREHGLIEPLVVTHGTEPDTYRLIAGERRLLAASMAGLHEVPAMVRTGTTAELAAVQAIENLHREDLVPLDIAEGLKALLPLYPRPRDLAKALGKSPSWLSKHLRLARLTPAVYEATANGLADVETITTLDTLARIKTDQAQVLLRLCLANAEAGDLTRNLARTRLAAARKAAPTPGSADGDEPGEDAEAGAEGNASPQAPKATFGTLVLAQDVARSLLDALRYANKHKPSSRPSDALIEHVAAFIAKTWPK